MKDIKKIILDEHENFIKEIGFTSYQILFQKFSENINPLSIDGQVKILSNFHEHLIGGVSADLSNFSFKKSEFQINLN